MVLQRFFSENFTIVLFIFAQGELVAKEFKWKFKERINHDNYYEAIGTGIKKVKIDEKIKRKFKITNIILSVQN